MFRMRDEMGLDDKVLCVAATDPRMAHLRDIEDAQSSTAWRSGTSSRFTRHWSPARKWRRPPGWTRRPPIAKSQRAGSAHAALAIRAASGKADRTQKGLARTAAARMGCGSDGRRLAKCARAWDGSADDQRADPWCPRGSSRLGVGDEQAHLLFGRDAVAAGHLAGVATLAHPHKCRTPSAARNGDLRRYAPAVAARALALGGWLQAPARRPARCACSGPPSARSCPVPRWRDPTFLFHSEALRGGARLRHHGPR